MWWFIGISFVISVFIYCILKTASDADDYEEKLWKERNDNFERNSDDNANSM
jgi:hypothetical protein